MPLTLRIVLSGEDCQTSPTLGRGKQGFKIDMNSGAQFEGDLGEILALGAEISPYISHREKWESPLKKKKKIFFFFFKFSSCQHTIDKLCYQFSPITSYFFFI